MEQASSPDGKESDFASRQASGLRTQIGDCRKALELLRSAEYERIQDYFKAIQAPYEQLLFNVNTDKEIRDRAAFALDLCRKHSNAALYFEKRLKDAQWKLNDLEGQKPSAEETLERSLLLIR